MSTTTPDVEPTKITVENDSVTVWTSPAESVNQALFITAMAAITALLARGEDSAVEAILESLDESLSAVVVIGD